MTKYVVATVLLLISVGFFCVGWPDADLTWGGIAAVFALSSLGVLMFWRHRV